MDSHESLDFSERLVETANLSSLFRFASSCRKNYATSCNRAHIYIYVCVYGTPPQKKTMFTSLFCWYLQYVVSIFGCLLVLSFFGVPCIYIYIYVCVYICARRLHDLFVHFGRNAFRMRPMHSECILDQNPDPRFPQDSWLKSWKNQDPRSKIPTRLLAKILEKPRSKIPTRLLAKILEKPRSKIQDSHKTPG